MSATLTLDVRSAAEAELLENAAISPKSMATRAVSFLEMFRMRYGATCAHGVTDGVGVTDGETVGVRVGVSVSVGL